MLLTLPLCARPKNKHGAVLALQARKQSFAGGEGRGADMSDNSQDYRWGGGWATMGLLVPSVSNSRVIKL